jgi:hypothetical protein
MSNVKMDCGLIPIQQSEETMICLMLQWTMFSSLLNRQKGP